MNGLYILVHEGVLTSDEFFAEVKRFLGYDPRKVDPGECIPITWLQLPPAQVHVLPPSLALVSRHLCCAPEGLAPPSSRALRGSLSGVPSAAARWCSRAPHGAWTLRQPF